MNGTLVHVPVFYWIICVYLFITLCVFTPSIPDQTKQTLSPSHPNAPHLCLRDLCKALDYPVYNGLLFWY